MEIKRYLQMVKKRLWFILLCVLVSTLTTAYYTDRYVQPVYQASTKILVNKTTEVLVGKDQSPQEQMDLGAMGSNIKLIDTYREMIRTPAVLDQVASQYPELNTTSAELASIVSLVSLNNSQVMSLIVIDSSYKRAADIVNAIADVFPKRVHELMKVDNMTVLEKAPIDITPRPINDSMNKNIMLSIAISLLFALGLTFLLEYLDDTVRSEEDILESFEAPTLAVVARLKKKDYVSRPGSSQQSTQVGETQYATANQ